MTVTLMLKRSDCKFDTVPIGGKGVEVVFWDTKMDKEQFLRVMMQCIVSDGSTFAVIKKEEDRWPKSSTLPSTAKWPSATIREPIPMRTP